VKLQINIRVAQFAALAELDDENVQRRRPPFRVFVFRAQTPVRFLFEQRTEDRKKSKASSSRTKICTCTILPCTAAVSMTT